MFNVFNLISSANTNDLFSQSMCWRQGWAAMLKACYGFHKKRDTWDKLSLSFLFGISSIQVLIYKKDKALETRYKKAP